MKTIIRSLLVLLLVTCLPTLSFADSPVTSTPIYQAYLDQPIVQDAQETGAMTQHMADYLKNPEHPLDIKAAVINALYHQGTWDTRNYAEVYAKLVYQKELAQLKLDQLQGDDLFNLGYLLLLDNYTEPTKALTYLEKAQDQDPQSFTRSVILALAQAQGALLDQDPASDPWLIARPILENAQLNPDMKAEALEIIRNYMKLYDQTAEVQDQQPDNAEAKALFLDWGNQQDVQVYIHGTSIAFDVAPRVDTTTNRTMVPFRKIFESLGAQVWFDESTYSVVAQKGNVLMRLPINQSVAYINGQRIQLDASTQIVNRRTLVPLRFVSQALGYQVTTKGALPQLSIYIN